MSIYDYMNAFWRKAEEVSFSPSEIAFYFYLLNKANAQKWQMPIRCPTEVAAVYIGTSKQNIAKVRDALKRHGLIDFTPGTGKGSHPLYTLCIPNNQLSVQLSVGLSQEMSHQLPQQLSPYKNKEKDQDNNSINHVRESSFCNEELEVILLADNSWQTALLSRLNSNGAGHVELPQLQNLISQFFVYLKSIGVEKTDDNECRRHCANWIVKKETNQNHQSNDVTSKPNNKSSSGEGSYTKKPSYYDPF